MGRGLYPRSKRLRAKSIVLLGDADALPGWLLAFAWMLPSLLLIFLPLQIALDEVDVALDSVHLGLQMALACPNTVLARTAPQQHADQENDAADEPLGLLDILAHVPRTCLNVLERLGQRFPNLAPDLHPDLIALLPDGLTDGPRGRAFRVSSVPPRRRRR